MSAGRPAYADLPVLIEKGSYRHAWDVYPAGDQRGSLNNIGAPERLDALRSVTEGSVVNLSLPLDLPDPPMFGRESFRHTIFHPGPNSMDDKLDGFFLQSSSQWDGFRHVRAREFGLFKGHQGDFDETGELGIQHFASTGIIGRGVLVDLSAKYLEQVERGTTNEGCTYSADDLREAVHAAGVDIRKGDVLCIRTGWMSHYFGGGPDVRADLATGGRWPGLAGSEAVAELLWDWEIGAVAADNPAIEVGPGRVEDGSLHRRSIPLLGLVFGELFDFEPLALKARELGRNDFFFMAVPLNLTGGVGSPANAVAMF